jgi:exopolyphosphatase / guanosine-5'-triphosphate,3'-diphosphate pyrophosphatase
LKLAAIDIGSNAIRMQVSQVLDVEQYLAKKIEYIRFPLRLGQDVFSYGEITPKTEEKFVKLMLAFKQFLELYEVDDYMVCATSAMREAHNGLSIAKRVYYTVGLKVNIIDGESEGNIINKAIFPFLDDGNYLHIDVGGGSTELGIISHREKTAVRSFRMGSVRSLPLDKEEKTFEKMKEWTQKYLPQDGRPIRVVATGGNIKKIVEIAGGTNSTISAAQLIATSELIAKFNYADRVRKFNMNPDRADVIIPAATIYKNVVQMANASEIIVPDVGLKDGIIMGLCQKYMA